MLSTTFILTNLLVLVVGQSLCTQQQGTPLCAAQFNGNYINCYCVVDPVTNTAVRRVTLEQSLDDLNLCQNSNQNTFCCPNNFLNRANTFTFNGYMYDKMCNNIGIATTTSIQSSTTNLEAFVTLYITPSPTTTTLVPTVVIEYVSTTVTTLVPTTVTTLVPTTVTTFVPTLVPTTVTTLVPTTVTTLVPTTVTSYVSDYQNVVNNLQVAPLPTQTVTVTKTLVKPRYITKTRIVKITNCN